MLSRWAVGLGMPAPGPLCLTRRGSRGRVWAHQVLERSAVPNGSGAQWNQGDTDLNISASCTARIIQK